MVTSIVWFTIPVNYAGSSLTLKNRYLITIVHLGKVIGVVWAGSQVSKPFRLSGAILFAPTADKLISFVQDKLNLKSRAAAFGLITTLLLTNTALFYVFLIALNVFILR